MFCPLDGLLVISPISLISLIFNSFKYSIIFGLFLSSGLFDKIASISVIIVLGVFVFWSIPLSKLLGE